MDQSSLLDLFASGMGTFSLVEYFGSGLGRSYTEFGSGRFRTLKSFSLLHYGSKDEEGRDKLSFFLV